MRWRRLLLGVAGVALLGLASTVADDGVLATAVRAGVESLGNDYLFVAVLGVAGCLVAASMLVSGRSGNLAQTDTPNPERPPTVPAVGEEFDRTVGGVRFAVPVVGRSARRRIRERLRTAAIAATMRADGCRRETAERRVDEGTWTDDPAAAAFLADGRSAAVGGRLAAWAAGETLRQRRARRTVDAIVERFGGPGAAR